MEEGHFDAFSLLLLRRSLDYSPWGLLFEDRGKNKQLGQQQPIVVRQAMKSEVKQYSSHGR